MTRLKRCTLSLLTLSVMASCAEQAEPEAEVPQEAAAPTAAADEPSLTDHPWSLVAIEMMDGEDVTPVEGSVPNLVFSEEATPTGSRGLAGSTGCNRLMGSYDAGRGGRIAIGGGIATTQMACPEPVMQVESIFTAALEGARSWVIEDGSLSIDFGGGVMVFAAGEVESEG